MLSQRKKVDSELTETFRFDDSVEYAQQNYQKKFQSYMDILSGEDKT